MKWVVAGNLAAAGSVRFAAVQSLFFGLENSVQFFDQLEKFVVVLFHRDKRAKLKNAVAVGFVHKAAVLQHRLYPVCSMSNTVEDAGQLL
jgi:hypothetical protein